MLFFKWKLEFVSNILFMVIASLSSFYFIGGNGKYKKFTEVSKFWLPKTENSEIFLKTTKIWTGRKTEIFQYDLEEKLKTFKISKF